MRCCYCYCICCLLSMSVWSVNLLKLLWGFCSCSSLAPPRQRAPSINSVAAPLHYYYVGWSPQRPLLLLFMKILRYIAFHWRVSNFKPTKAGVAIVEWSLVSAGRWLLAVGCSLLLVVGSKSMLLAAWLDGDCGSLVRFSMLSSVWSFLASPKPPRLCFVTALIVIALNWLLCVAFHFYCHHTP